MSEIITDRNLITLRVLSILMPNHTELDLENALKTWWKNLRSSGGLRLTSYGDEQFTRAEFECWEFDLGQASYMGNMASSLVLDRKLPSPYYYVMNDRRRSVRIYDSRVAAMVALHGNIRNYLDTLDPRPEVKYNNKVE